MRDMMTIRQMTDEELRYEGEIAARKYRREIRRRKEEKRKKIIGDVLAFMILIAMVLVTTVMSFEMKFSFDKREPATVNEVISAEMAD